MARFARIVIPGVPHLVTQRGVQDVVTFRDDADYAYYLALLTDFSKTANVKIWAYCLAPTQVHLIIVPKDEDGLRRALGETHRRYARYVNARDGRQGPVWRDRFHSSPLDKTYLLEVARYTELGPVREGLCKKPDKWPWSSARAHIKAKKDPMLRTKAILKRSEDWQKYLNAGVDDAMLATIHSHEKTGRPLGSHVFIEELEEICGRVLQLQRPGRKPRAVAPD